MFPNDPAADPLVESAARSLCRDAGLDPDAAEEGVEPLWRRFIDRGVSSLNAHEVLFGRRP